MNRPKVYKVLLLEDDESSAKLLLHTLERYNFDITHVVDGMSGLTKIRNNTYDLVISDVNMPYLDGISFLEKGKEMLKTTPVIMLTAVGEKDQVRRAALSHVTAYLLKPIANQALLEKIAQVLQLKPENIIDKKEFPLVINVSELSISQMLLEIKGCPGKKALEEIYDRFMLSLGGRGTFTNLRINLDNTFFYEVRSLQVLDDLIAKILKQTNIRASSLFLDSEFFNNHVVDLQPYSYLSEVNIISK
ncbi:response regulator [Leptospira congkakensis]|uniref:Response regulator n=1 Tax=Leptospira congkakensis TaxID=2484932 RepID=A0A4Z1AB05_9LEPT|nr:response regulator [Leptospira congkakensis]TGL86664.1 response regulator [Leptospira congkakensis]TGL93791.1 response regulator [Leptospira congkakensis]TGL94803.1 response regulator [Leptospira congkakensis]